MRVGNHRHLDNKESSKFERAANHLEKKIAKLLSAIDTSIKAAHVRIVGKGKDKIVATQEGDQSAVFIIPQQGFLDQRRKNRSKTHAIRPLNHA